MAATAGTCSFTCIVGPQSCGKTSLLFQHAITCAEQGQNVLLLSPSALKELPLLSSDQSQPHPSTLERIHLKYPATLFGLQELFDGIHEVRPPQMQAGVPGLHGDGKGMYTCIILDEFHNYFTSMLQCKSHEQLAAVAKTCAHVTDAVNFIMSLNQARRGTGDVCSCLLSMDEPAPIPGLKVDVVQRWFPNVLQITLGSEDCSYVVSHWDKDRKDRELQPPMASYTIHQTHFRWHQKLNIH